MTYIFRWLNVIIIAVMLLLLPAMSIVGAEAATEQPEANPVIGVVLLLTDQVKAEKNNKPYDMFSGALREKLAKKADFAVINIADAELITYLSKKDITADSNGLLKELKLPQLLEYGKSKNLDYLLVVIGDAKVAHHMKTNISTTTDKNGKVTSSHAYETDEVDYGEVTLRAAYVDIKKGEYIQNYSVTRRSGDPAMFGNPVRSVVNDGCGRVLGEFNSHFNL